MVQETFSCYLGYAIAISRCGNILGFTLKNWGCQNAELCARFPHSLTTDFHRMPVFWLMCWVDVW